MSRRARRTSALLALTFAGAWIGSPGTATATMPMQKKAKDLGIASVQNCQSCHVEKMPKKGASTMNDRGKWLMSEKDKRKAGEVDVGWLKDYVEKK